MRRRLPGGFRQTRRESESTDSSGEGHQAEGGAVLISASSTAALAETAVCKIPYPAARGRERVPSAEPARQTAVPARPPAGAVHPVEPASCDPPAPVWQRCSDYRSDTRSDLARTASAHPWSSAPYVADPRERGGNSRLNSQELLFRQLPDWCGNSTNSSPDSACRPLTAT